MSVDKEKLKKLAELLKSRNKIEGEIAGILGRPVEKGHLGECIAENIFGIKLYKNANHKGADGAFTYEPLSGNTVNIKYYGKQDGLLAIHNEPDKRPCFYLVITGPKIPAGPSRGEIRPFVIDAVYLFKAEELAKDIEARKTKFGVAASFRKETWENAQIYPKQTNKLLVLSEEQKEMLGWFKGTGTFCPT